VGISTSPVVDALYFAGLGRIEGKTQELPALAETENVT
jgi:hypothetical protein